MAALLVATQIDGMENLPCKLRHAVNDGLQQIGGDLLGAVEAAIMLLAIEQFLQHELHITEWSFELRHVTPLNDKPDTWATLRRACASPYTEQLYSWTGRISDDRRHGNLPTILTPLADCSITCQVNR